MPHYEDADDDLTDDPVPGSDDAGDDEDEGFTDPDLDEDFPTGDGTADGDAVITCPYCGEQVEIVLDAGSGARQEYVEDCEICCQPWRLSVHYGADGRADVQVTPLDE